METNEQAQRERYQEVERTLVRLVEEVEGIEDGNLREFEQKIYKGVLELGRNLFQCRINQSGEKAPGGIRWESVGHKQHIVDYRIKQILTMMGKVNSNELTITVTREKSKKVKRRNKSNIALWRGLLIRSGE